MSLTLKMIYSCLTGAWGGFAAWFVLDVLLRAQSPNPYLDAVLNGAGVGVFVGAFTGAFSGLFERRLKTLLRGLAIGGGVGLIGGAAGLLIGEVLFQALGQTAAVRVIGWALFGLVIGCGEGILRRSWRRALLGAAGGTAGGILGSLAFMAARSALDLPGFSRAAGFTLLGALIGLLIGFVPVAVRGLVGTLKVVSSGRNEGKEILLEQRVTRIGRDERCELSLFGDEAVQPRHAEIQRGAAGFILIPVGGAPVSVNSQPVVQHTLQKDDRIQIGREEIVFR